MPEETARGKRRLLRLAARSAAGLAGARSGLAAALLALGTHPARAASILAVRVWPAREYTRVTLELDEPLKSTQMQLSDPPRLVVDLEGLEIDLALRDLVARIRAEDPYIRQVRVGQHRPRVARLVFDLKTEVAPQLFTLAPVGTYRHRLVLDLHPAVPIDPLKTLLDDVRARSARPALPPPEDPIAALLRERLAAQERFAQSDEDVPREAQPVMRGKRRPPAVTRMLTIAIDAGHGGEDPGAIGRRGTQEKDVVLRIAQMLRERVNAEPDMRAYMIRDGDYFVPLAMRVAKARRVQADLFVSIHADAVVRPQASGASVYVLSERGASSSTARFLASRENASDRIGGVNLPSRNREVRQLLLDLTTTAQIQDSSRLGHFVLSELGGVGQLHKPRIEQAGFAVLKAPDIPSILVETAFISNPREERRLADSRYQARVADAIFRGLRSYLQRHPPAPRARVT
ncbi:MAG TPA: N-acetylmuramoyl-L-alanine amidase [Burkholderiaceae bacterium]|nr:N-acetylmuramoyl-L-alanine amidase [Burkholderiaceae bacterium]